MKGTQVATQAGTRGKTQVGTQAGTQGAAAVRTGASAYAPGTKGVTAAQTGALTAVTGAPTAAPVPAPAPSAGQDKQGHASSLAEGYALLAGKGPSKPGNNAEQERKLVKRVLAVVGVMLGIFFLLFLYAFMDQGNIPMSTTPKNVTTTVKTVITTATQAPSSTPEETLVCLMNPQWNLKTELLMPCSTIVVIFAKLKSLNDISMCKWLEEVALKAPLTMAISTKLEYSDGIEGAFKKLENLCGQSRERGLAEVDATKSLDVDLKNVQNVSMVHVLGPAASSADFLNDLKDMASLSLIVLSVTRFERTCDETPPSDIPELMNMGTSIKKKLSVALAIASTASIITVRSLEGGLLCRVQDESSEYQGCEGKPDVPGGWKETCDTTVLLYETKETLRRKVEESKKRHILCAVIDAEKIATRKAARQLTLEDFSCGGKGHIVKDADSFYGTNPADY